MSKPSKQKLEDFSRRTGISDDVSAALLQKKVRDVSMNKARAMPRLTKIKKQNEN